MTRKRASERRQSIYKSIRQGLIKAFTWFVVITTLWVLVYRFVNPPITWLMVQRGVEQKMEGEGFRLEQEWRGLDEISSNLKRAVLAGEDAAFLIHWGFDIQAIQKAYEGNQTGERIRGASTISQQTAKNVFLWPGRSWLRKGFEVYFTVLIELLWGKERILEVYLNVIETGEGIYGVEAACQHYYDRSSESLSKGRAALLVAVLPNPLKWSPIKPTRYIYRRQYLILRNMRRIGNIPF